jgi:hypothetical protein
MTSTKAVSGLFLASFMAACASSPTAPHEELAAADLAVRQIQESSASEHAPGELRLARSKLEQAQTAMQHENYIRARRMAEQAIVDARLADVKTDAARSEEILAQSNASVEALEREALELSQ